MGGHEDIIQIAKDRLNKCKKELDKVLSEKEKLELRAVTLKSDLNKLAKVMAALTEGKDQKTKKKQPKASKKKASAGRGDSATKFVLQVLTEASNPMRADEILTAMVNKAWRSHSSKPIMVIRNTLINLKKKNKIITTDRGLFSIAQQA